MITFEPPSGPSNTLPYGRPTPKAKYKNGLLTLRISPDHLRRLSQATSASSSAPSGPCKLLELPAEIRLRIYDFVFDQKTIVLCGDRLTPCQFTIGRESISNNTDQPQPISFQLSPRLPKKIPASPHALIETCKLIHNEALPYTQTEYELVCCEHAQETFYRACNRFSDSWRRRFVKLRIFGCRGRSGSWWRQPSLAIDLPCLRKVEMSPRYPRRYYGPVQMLKDAYGGLDATLKNDMAHFVRWDFTQFKYRVFHHSSLRYSSDVEFITKLQSKTHARGSTEGDFTVRAVWDHAKQDFLHFEMLTLPDDSTWLYKDAAP